MVARSVRQVAVFIAPLAIAALLFSLATEEDNPRASRIIMAIGFTLPMFLLSIAAFQPEEVGV